MLSLERHMMVRVLDPDEKSKKEIHPHALKRFRDWQDEVEREVPQLVELTDSELNADVARYLTEDEQAEAKAYREEIIDWLLSCMDTEKTASSYALPQYNTWIISTMLELKKLLRTVYQQKEEEAQQEAERVQEEKRQRAKKAEDERRWDAAYKALNVPATAAIKYLRPEEYDDFARSILGAVDAYLKEGEHYALDKRSNPYLRFIFKIKNRRAEEAAEAEGWRFNKSLHEVIEALKPRLHIHRENISKYFGKGRPLASHDLYECLSQKQQQVLFDYAKTRVRSELGKLIPEDYSDFVEWDNKYWFRFSPIADYAYEGVPCLAFSFRLEIVAESKVMLKPVVKQFDGIPFELPREEYRTKDGISYWTVLDKPILLGYLYTHLIPAEVPVVPWQTIPTTLLLGLLQGELVPKGCKVIKASEAEVIYEIKGFAEWVTVPASFHACLGESRGFEGLAAAGVFSNQTFKIIIEQARGLNVTSIQETTATEQPHDCTEDEFINRLTGLGYPKAHAEILYQKKPEGLGLDEAVRWALREYRKIIPENTGTDVQDDSRTQIH